MLPFRSGGSGHRLGLGCAFSWMSGMDWGLLWTLGFVWQYADGFVFRMVYGNGLCFA